MYKKGDQLLVDNYRPISLISVFSKIFEKIIYARLINFLNKHHILYDYQFGFRKGYSCTLSLIEILDSIYEHLDNNELVLGIFLDLTKAFDTVNHSILLKKLYHYGIRGNLYNWIESYLSERTQFTVIKDTQSKKMKIKSGVPQGSVLGPLLFLIYINDIGSVNNDFKIRLFADDSNVFIFHKNISDLFKLANSIQ